MVSVANRSKKLPAAIHASSASQTQPSPFGFTDETVTPPTNQFRSPEYGELVAECARWGIRRTKAFELSRLKLIDTFSIGRKKYVMLESLATLPARLSAGGAK